MTKEDGRGKQDRIKQISRIRRATELLRFLDGPGSFVCPSDIAVQLNKGLPALSCQHNFPFFPLPGSILSFPFPFRCSSVAFKMRPPAFWGDY